MTGALSRGLAAAAAAVGLVVTLTVGTAGASGPLANVKTHVLSLSELPAGWTVSPGTGSGSGHLTTSACLRTLHKAPKGGSRADPGFTSGSSVPIFDELLVTGPKMATLYRNVHERLDRCRTISFTAKGKTLTGAIAQMSFPALGVPSAAYEISLTLTKVRFGFDLVLFRVGAFVGLTGFGDVGTPDITTAEHFTAAAVDKAEGKPVHLATGTVPPTATG